MSDTYPKRDSQGVRVQSTGSKCIDEQDVQFGETVQLHGGVPISRKFTKDYKKGELGDGEDNLSAGLYGLLGPASGPLSTR